MTRRFIFGLLLCLALASCDSSDGGADAGRDAGEGERDAAVVADGGRDAGQPLEDAGRDAGETEVDAGSDGGSADAGADAGSPDAGPPDAGLPVCAVGALCNDTQPCGDDDRCYGSAGDGFCAHFTPECGGFLMIDCTGGRVCLRGGGSSLGYCATPAERDCICDMAAARGMSVDGCR